MVLCKTGVVLIFVWKYDQGRKKMAEAAIIMSDHIDSSFFCILSALHWFDSFCCGAALTLIDWLEARTLAL